jgi:peptidylprolyl isomerase
MTQAKKGDKVAIHYTGRLTDGTEFDTSAGKQPLEFEVGAGQIISGLDEKIEGMAVGETAKVTVPAADAYGEHDPTRVHQLPREQIPEEIELAAGKQLSATTSDGSEIALNVVEVGDEFVTVDANHPLAGKDLEFELELVEIVEAA